MRLSLTTINIVVFTLIFVALHPATGQAQEEEELPHNEVLSEEVKNHQAVSNLRELIEQKNSELQKIQAEREALEKNLEEVNKLNTTLKKDLRTIDYTISQLTLGIKANKLTLEKLELEIGELSENIRNSEDSIKNKKETIGKLLVELQLMDRENVFTILLKKKSLAESVAEVQTILTLNQSLTANIDALRKLQSELVEKVDEKQTKKDQHQIEKSNLLNRQYILKEEKGGKQKLLTQTKNQEKVYREQIVELEKKQEEISRVIEEIEEKLRAEFDPSLLPLKRPSVLAYPVQNQTITQKYGKTKFAERAYRSKFHTGIDFQAPVGTPVFAAEDGKVIAVDNNDKGSSRWQKFQYGRYTIIEHPNNLATLYAHLSRTLVQKGSEVKRGDLIGYSGNTGYSFGPHLHFTVYWAPSVQFRGIPPASGLVPIGVTIDPEDYL